ncbi:MAG: glycosyltransferase [Candidatus Saganbacteria bacterium]|nr:glycosyltransferase [Candidatus Saganbacteria bacterium]
MKVISFNSSDLGGGAGKVAYRLSQRFLEMGHDVSLLVGKKFSDDSWVEQIIPNRLVWILDRLVGRALNFSGFHFLFYPSSLKISFMPILKGADIIHLHNLHGEYLSLWSLLSLKSKAPLIWTLHDMWPVTGHCAAFYECDHWKKKCKNCPFLKAYPEVMWDSSFLQWKVKKHVFERAKPVFVCPSRWLFDLVKSSPMLSNFEIYHIPNGVDLSVFTPIPKETARDVLKINKKHKVLLVSARNGRDERKGGEILKKALPLLKKRYGHNLTLLCLGQGVANSFRDIDGLNICDCGFVQKDLFLAICYAAADLLLFPSLAENFPNTILEAMACGTPSVSFDVGGIREMVAHRKTGYLADYNNLLDFVNGVFELLDDLDLYKGAVQNGLDLVSERFSLAFQHQQYLSLYKKIRKE